MGYYVVGRYTSVAWCLRREDAERVARHLNQYGGTHYTVEQVKGTSNV